MALAGLARHHQARLDEVGVAAVIREDRGQRIPALRRVTQTEALGDLPRQAATFEVVDGARRVLESLPVEGGRGVEQRAQCLGAAAARVGARTALVGDLEAKTRGEALDRLDEAEVLVLHDEADRRAVRPAAEAVIELFGRAHREGG